MKFFMLSKCGEGAGLIYKIQCEGNDCTIKIKEKDYYNVYDGILEKGYYPDNDAIVIVDSSGMGSEADNLKKKGFKVFGGSSFADKLENDREFGFEFMKNHGIQTPRTQNFKSFEDGISYVKERKTKLVFKPSGNLPCKLTYCSESSEDLINYMKFVEEYYSKEIDDFIIQDFIEGEVISTEFWVGPKGFIHPANHTVEVKKFLNDNLGPSTGCQGNLIWIAEDDLVVDALLKTEKSLIKENFIGCIDLNCIINETGLYGLEWTPRFGLDAMPTFLQFFKDKEIGKLILDITTGTVQEMNSFEDEFAAGIRLSIPPYPSEPKSTKSLEKQVPSEGVPIESLLEYWDNVYPYEVMIKDSQLVHSCGTGVIAVISDVSNDCDQVLDDPYDMLDEIKIIDKQYRTDLGIVLPDMYDKAMEVLDNENIRS